MGYIFVDREEGGGMEKMRQNMRRNMRGGNYRYPMMRRGEDGYEHGYRQGYKHGWEDHEDETMGDDEMEYRRSRDSRGRFI